MATSTTQKNTDNLKATKPKAAKVGSTLKHKAKAKARASTRPGAQIYRQGRDAVSGIYDSASKASARAKRGMPDLRSTLDVRAHSQSLYTTIEEHPFVMGAVGLGVGMVLAALLPSANAIGQKR